MAEKSLGRQEASITAQNTGTGALTVPKGKPVNISISGTFAATVFVQRSFDQGSTWLDVESHTAPVERIMDTPENTTVRLFVKTGGFTSGTVVARVSIG